MTSINLAKCPQIREDSVINLARNCPNLTELDLGALNGLGHSGVEMLSMCRSLRVISLRVFIHSTALINHSVDSSTLKILAGVLFVARWPADLLCFRFPGLFVLASSPVFSGGDGGGSSMRRPITSRGFLSPALLRNSDALSSSGNASMPGMRPNRFRSAATPEAKPSSSLSGTSESICWSIRRE